MNRGLVPKKKEKTFDCGCLRKCCNCLPKVCEGQDHEEYHSCILILEIEKDKLDQTEISDMLLGMFEGEFNCKLEDQSTDFVSWVIIYG